MLEQVLAEFVPDPQEASQGKVVLVDGTLVTTWDWRSRGTALFSGKHRDTGFNLQVAATLTGDLLAVSALAPGSCHDARAFRESGFADLFADRDTLGDFGYIGTGIQTGRRKPPGQERPAGDKILNQSINTLRAAVERAIAHLKDWKILATRYRGPLDSLPNIVRIVTALAFFRTTW